MGITLSLPVTSAEAAAYRAAGHWSDHIAVDTASLAALGSRPALVDRRGRWTYAELAAASDRLAGTLHELGVGAGDAVVIVADNDRESAAAYHATGRLGAVAVLVHRASGASDVAFACAASAPRVVLLAPTAHGLGAAATGEGRTVHAVADLLGADGPPPPRPTVDPDAARLVIFTSGTTSAPKGVVHTENTLRASTANYRATTDLTGDDRFFLVSPLASIAGVLQVLYLAPLLGAAAVLEHAFDEEGTLDLLTETGGTFYGGTDVVLGRLLAAARRRGVGVPLRGAAVGGTMLRHDLLLDAEATFGIVVQRVYGSSEVPSSTSAVPDEAQAVRLGDDGRPAPGVEVRVLDDGTQELLVRGPHRFRGYLDPRDNEGAFEGDWFRTGDAAELVDGRLRVVGRLKEIASRSGKKISLAEVEQAFAAATGLEACAAFAAPDDVTGERVVVAVRLLEGATLDVPAALDAMGAAGFAKWKLPEAVVRHDGPFPMTATGKVLRRALSEEASVPLWRAERLASHDTRRRAQAPGSTSTPAT